MKYDLIVVGAGILGAFHAYHAAKLGKKVLLLEKDEKSKGSTTQNFGQVVPSGLNEEWQKFGRRSLEIYKELELKANLGVRSNGSIYIASDEDEHTLLEELHLLHQDRNYESIFLTKKTISQKIPAIQDSYAMAGLFYPQEVSINPLEMIHRLIAYLQEQLKVEFFSKTEVIAVDHQNHEVKLITDRGQSFVAEAAIICSGYYTNQLFKDYFKNKNLIVSKLHMMRTTPLQQLQLKPNILTGLTIRRYESFQECPSANTISIPDRLRPLVDLGIHILFKQEMDGRIIIGDSHEYAPAQEMEQLELKKNTEIDSLILDEAKRILNFDLDQIEHFWSGFYLQHNSGILDEKLTPNIKICTGIGGKGMTSSAGYSEFSIRKFYNL